MGLTGDKVQEQWDAGHKMAISDYCRCDVLDTYFVFLRASVLTGAISLEREQELVRRTRQWLEDSSEEFPIYQQYLENWGDWKNPWEG